MPTNSGDLPQRRRSGTALCLSGGGFRATLFHLGALRRLNELGLLAKIDTFSSVSGGSILNGFLAVHWPTLCAGLDNGVFNRFEECIAAPMRAFCRQDLRTALGAGHLLGAVTGKDAVTRALAAAYDTKLGLSLPLRRMPAKPAFVFCASNMGTGANWEFRQHEMGDYKVGYTSPGDLTVGMAVAASSAFPLLFPPLELAVDPASFAPHGGLHQESQPGATVFLSDGGIYDNHGMEPVWKSHQLVLVSDGGAPFQTKPTVGSDLLSRHLRAFDVTDNQSRALRRRWLISSFLAGHLEGTYWSVSSDYQSYQAPGGLTGYAPEVQGMIANIRTDLDAFSDLESDVLENHGYILADTAVRRWLPQHLPAGAPAPPLPHPNRGPGKVTAESLVGSADRGIRRDAWSLFKHRLWEWANRVLR